MGCQISRSAARSVGCWTGLRSWIFPLWRSTCQVLHRHYTVLTKMCWANPDMTPDAGPSLVLGAACRPLKRLCTDLCVGPGLSQQHFRNIAQFSRLTALSITSQSPAYNSSHIYHNLPDCLTNLTNLQQFILWFSPCMPTALSTLLKLDNITLVPCSATSAITRNLEGFSTMTSLALHPGDNTPVPIKLPKGQMPCASLSCKGISYWTTLTVQSSLNRSGSHQIPYLNWTGRCHCHT